MLYVAAAVIVIKSMGDWMLRDAILHSAMRLSHSSGCLSCDSIRVQIRDTPGWFNVLSLFLLSRNWCNQIVFVFVLFCIFIRRRWSWLVILFFWRNRSWLVAYTLLLLGLSRLRRNTNLPPSLATTKVVYKSLRRFRITTLR